MSQKEIEDALKALTVQQTKIAKEQGDRFDAQTAAIKALQDLINAGGDATPEVVAALKDLQTTTQALDDVIPDQPV